MKIIILILFAFSLFQTPQMHEMHEIHEIHGMHIAVPFKIRLQAAPQPRWSVRCCGLLQPILNRNSSNGKFEIIGIYLKEDGHLLLNVSSDILSFGGGTYFEGRIVDSLLEFATSIPNAKYLTLLIEGTPQKLPEGTEIFYMPLIPHN